MCLYPVIHCPNNICDCDRCEASVFLSLYISVETNDPDHRKASIRNGGNIPTMVPRLCLSRRRHRRLRRHDTPPRNGRSSKQFRNSYSASPRHLITQAAATHTHTRHIVIAIDTHSTEYAKQYEVMSARCGSPRRGHQPPPLEICRSPLGSMESMNSSSLRGNI